MQINEIDHTNYSVLFMLLYIYRRTFNCGKGAGISIIRKSDLNEITKHTYRLQHFIYIAAF